MRILKNKNMEELERDIFFNTQDTKLYRAANQRGSVTRLIFNVMNKGVAALYQYVDERQEAVFLSSAQEEEIDEIGALINCRRNGLTDLEYKEKIRNYTTILEKANIMSIFWSAKLPHITDMDFKNNSYGANSFTVIPYTSVPIVSASDLEAIADEINRVVSYGVRFQVINPVLLRVSILIKPVFYSRANEFFLDNTALNSLVYSGVVNYLASLRSGAPFDKGAMLRVMKADNANLQLYLKDLIVLELKINGWEIKDTFFSAGWNQRIIEDEHENSIIIE